MLGSLEARPTVLDRRGRAVGAGLDSAVQPLRTAAPVVRERPLRGKDLALAASQRAECELAIPVRLIEHAVRHAPPAPKEPTAGAARPARGWLRRGRSPRPTVK